jgi:phosphoribosylformimino-5-aminoimidazole carboxamide ribotide isomerase
MLWVLRPSCNLANLVWRETPGAFAGLYKLHGLEGGHMIKLGPGNDEAAKDALRAWPGLPWFCPHWVADHECIKHSGGLQIGGGITDKDALSWIECGASKVKSCYIESP